MGNSNGRQTQSRGDGGQRSKTYSDLSVSSCFDIIISGLFRRRHRDASEEGYSGSHEEGAAARMRRARLGNDDHLLYYSVSEPGIDWKADAFIKRFHDSQTT